MIELNESLQQFLAEVFPAIVGTKRRNGNVHMNPVWFEYQDSYVWLNSWRGAKWLENVERDGGLTLLFLDPQNMFRFAEIQGRLVAATEEGGAAHIDRLAVRYTGQTYQRHMPGVARVKVQIEPLRVTGTFNWQPPSQQAEQDDQS